MAIWILDSSHPLRRLCRWFYDLKYFDDCSNLMVLFSTILLAIDNPLDNPESRKQIVLKILDYVTTTIFSLEALIKICVFGFLFNGKKSYFRVAWNILDFFVVGISLFSYLPLGANL